MRIDNNIEDLIVWLKKLDAIEVIEFYINDAYVRSVYSIDEFAEVIKQYEPFNRFKYQILFDGLDEENPKRRLYWFYPIQSSSHDIKIVESL